MHQFARDQIESRFLLDECLIVDERVDEEGTLNEATFEVTFDDPEQVYAGPCSFTDRIASRSDREGYATLQADELLLKLPPSAVGIRVGMIVTAVTSADDALVEPGEEFTVSRVVASTHRITRRVVLRRAEAYPSPGGVAA